MKDITQVKPAIIRVHPTAVYDSNHPDMNLYSGAISEKLTVEPTRATLNWKPKTMFNSLPLNQETA